VVGFADDGKGTDVQTYTGGAWQAVGSAPAEAAAWSPYGITLRYVEDVLAAAVQRINADCSGAVFTLLSYAGDTWTVRC
jgi:hypothetical protein